MKTPHLDAKINELEEVLNDGVIYPSPKLLYSKELEEYKAIKSFIETYSNKEKNSSKDNRRSRLKILSTTYSG